MSVPATPVWRSAEAAARQWRGNLPGYDREISTAKGVLIFTVAATLYILTFLGTFLLPSAPLRLASLLLNPVTIGMLFVIGHDACHGSLTRSAFLNRLLGRLVFLPPLHPYSAWAHAHNSMHHGWTNFKGREPAFPPFSKEEFDRLPLWRRWLEWFYRSAPGIGFYYFADFYAKHLLFPRNEHRSPYRLVFQLDRLLVAGFLALQFTAAWHLAEFRQNAYLPSPAIACVAVVVPFLLWVWFMGFVSFIQHTHPTMPWYNKEEEWSFYRVQLTSTAHVTFPWVIERILHNIMDHPAHHIDPQIPLTSLPRSQRRLERGCPEHAVVIRWTLFDYLKTTSKCKLYDFDRHCWLDFKGKPTTPLGLPELARDRGRSGEPSQASCLAATR
jgi:acyl-lipid omega-6 desaturase (Delta-12 desaturase)